MTTDREPWVQAYEAALRLPDACGDTDPAAAALNRAHELRRFEIDNYWKRATYFWAFQLAAFTSLGLLWAPALDPKGHLGATVLMIPAGLGAVTALVGLLSARGSKFWQENWEGHVDALEGDREGRLTQVVVFKEARSYSVSRVNERLMILLTAGWVLFFLNIAFRLDRLIPDGFLPFAGVAILAVAIASVLVGTRTDLEGWRYDLTGGQWRRYDGRDKAKATYLVLRDVFNKRGEPPVGRADT